MATAFCSTPPHSFGWGGQTMSSSQSNGAFSSNNWVKCTPLFRPMFNPASPSPLAHVTNSANIQQSPFVKAANQNTPFIKVAQQQPYQQPQPFQPAAPSPFTKAAQQQPYQQPQPFQPAAPSPFIKTANQQFPFTKAAQQPANQQSQPSQPIASSQLTKTKQHQQHPQPCQTSDSSQANGLMPTVVSESHSNITNLLQELDTVFSPYNSRSKSTISKQSTQSPSTRRVTHSVKQGSINRARYAPVRRFPASDMSTTPTKKQCELIPRNSTRNLVICNDSSTINERTVTINRDAGRTELDSAPKFFGNTLHGTVANTAARQDTTHSQQATAAVAFDVTANTNKRVRFQVAKGYEVSCCLHGEIVKGAENLAALSPSQIGQLKNLTIRNPNVGAVVWPGALDVDNMCALDTCVIISRKEIIVNDPAPLGKGLNREAVVTLNVGSISRKKIEQTTEKFNGVLISYDDGLWKFRVKHFL